MTAAEVLAAAADRIEGRPTHVNEREFQHSAGPAVYSAIYQVAQQLYGWTAVEAMQRYLHLSQLQHWQATDTTTIVEALRAAAKEPVQVDDETKATRAKLGEFHTTLGEALGWGPWAAMTSPDALVAEVVDRMSGLEKQVAHLEKLLAEEQHQHRITGQIVWTQKERIDELNRQLQPPAEGAVLPAPPITITETED